MSDPIWEGTTVRLRGTFKDHDGNLVSPTAVSLEVEGPDGVDVAVPSPTEESEGIWSSVFSVDDDGCWRYRWEGSGALVVAGEGLFYVRPTGMDN